MGLCPTPQFLFEKINPEEANDDPINNHFCERCITNGYRIFCMGIATYVDVRVWNKK